MNYKKTNWSELNPIDVWNTVRMGSLKVFPDNYLTTKICKELIRILVLEELNFSRKEILTINFAFLSKYKLGGTRKFLPNNLYGSLDFCFPEFKIKPWELSRVPKRFWKIEKNRTDFIKWIAEKEKINLSKIEDIKKFSSNLIEQYGGSKPLTESGSLFNLLNPAVDEKLDFHEWNLTKMLVWNKENSIKAIHWLIEEKLQWSHEEVYNNLSSSTFYKNDLGGMLSKFFGNSPLRAIQLAYPGEYGFLKNTQPKQFQKSRD